MTIAVPAGDNTFNPLEARFEDEELVRQLQQGTVANIRDSYHGRYDSFAESIQNAVDAIVKRWSPWTGPGGPVPGGEHAERPQIRVTIDCATQTVEVFDNGSGMTDSALRSALVPNVSLKRGDSDQRGHKGVGTTYLTYGHDFFEVETKTASGIIGYRMVQGLTWIKAQAAGPAPVFEPIEPTNTLSDVASGTVVRMRFGTGTNYGSLATTFYNSLTLWDVVLRTYTAIGLVSLRGVGTESPPWERETTITLRLSGVAGAGTATLPFRFAFPHEALPQAEVAELQSLQNAPTAAAKYKMIYLSRDHQGLLQLLQPELAKLAGEDEDLRQELIQELQNCKIAAYASLAYKNTLYEEVWRAAIGNPDAKRYTAMNVKGGVLIASVGMPMGETLPHREDAEVGIVLKPEERRRYFLLLHFNESYRPDIGRKTVPRERERIVGWLEAALLRVLRPWTTRLQVTNEDSTHNAASFAQAQEQLSEAEGRLVSLHEGDARLTLAGLQPARRCRTEAEVASQFASLLSRGYLNGYEVLALPGNETRYDALVTVNLATPAEQATGLEALTGISQDRFVNNSFTRARKWLEFKLNLADLVDEFELADGTPNKKYFTQVSLAVCWSSAGPMGVYDLVPLDDTNRSQRSYPGATHFLSKDGNDHRVEVIELQTLVHMLIEAIA